MIIIPSICIITKPSVETSSSIRSTTKISSNSRKTRSLGKNHVLLWHTLTKKEFKDLSCQLLINLSLSPSTATPWPALEILLDPPSAARASIFEGKASHREYRYLSVYAAFPQKKFRAGSGTFHFSFQSSVSGLSINRKRTQVQALYSKFTY